MNDQHDSSTGQLRSSSYQPSCHLYSRKDIPDGHDTMSVDLYHATDRYNLLKKRLSRGDVCRYHNHQNAQCFLNHDLGPGESAKRLVSMDGTASWKVLCISTAKFSHC